MLQLFLPENIIMILKHYESPFHVTHSDEVASKMTMKMDLSIMLSKLIKDKGCRRRKQPKYSK